MAGYSGNAEALRRPPAPEGFVFRPPAKLPGFVELREAAFRGGAAELTNPRREAGLLGSLVDRPAVFRRNDVGWIAACAWRARAKADDIAALKRAKRELDPRLIGEAAELVSALVRQLHGEGAAAAVTCVPCGHSRRSDCLGKRLAQGVAEFLGLPFSPGLCGSVLLRRQPPEGILEAPGASADRRSGRLDASHR